ncbi:MAG TPA: peptidoglycan DD-metalloendopeptidase family protein [Pseudomonadales bacterium]|jgi:murein DD-endopeptidase MepM/ murein hydrolase activator NlpD|nr:peptidase M23 [Gammaproteobacteria bacterium]MDP6027584.1 peptidoglycan DD-metalloendopeptidase family protein [Pseudomonadales bacterium]MDP6267403.1 peptidoglycan DD-metalloendopeptidase family protein [Arenicellales bacterium]MDP7313177.1 peptidoglycan DD-metalloendopeptidase family protein [Pseudomonadales bacterium]MDP7452227.1 peptidoglycan DD-metalloendopeptidase family protein [Arenicellales bacterium]|tara:strand:+ start:282 stop:1088 length:807 start_codon:yes stop_codon:yes gene_type:complete
MIPRLFIFLCCLLTSCLVFGLPENLPVPGGIAIVEIEDAGAKVIYRNSRVMTLREQEQSFAIVGIPLSADPGTHKLKVGNRTREFVVQPKRYREQHLTIKNDRQVNPYQQDLERIANERAEMDEVFTSFDVNVATFTEFQLPVDGPISSPFGLKRFLNEQPRSPHSGLDIAVDEGVAIKATAPGIVAVTGNYFFNGNTVLVDHGQGLISMYCHMSRIDVALGNKVDSDDILGAVGQTGRVTGPHLHWSVSLNNVRVDPNLFLGSRDSD